ncbi:MAG: 16S rRNA (guanine(527)-N(7))-methyltransferase RsmG [Pseudomonadota bacterium]
MAGKAAELLADVSRETEARLQTYYKLLRRWNQKINLVAPSTIEDAWQRHFLDSLQILDGAPEGWQTWVDLGSGGGFPGMVVAISVDQGQMERRVTLIESDQRKATFLRTVARETQTPVSILSERIEAADPLAADVVSARALAPLGKLLSLAEPHCHPEGTLLFHKGEKVQSELSEARKSWQFKVTESPSLTDPTASILKIRELRRV